MAEGQAVTAAAIDHLAVLASYLDDGTMAVEEALGLPLSPGGQHFAMGTHNRLMGLGPGTYLEVISVDRDAPAPVRARWFGLDRMTGPPRLGAWVVRVPDIAAILPDMPADLGQPLALTRGSLSWQITVPPTGEQPFWGLFPALIAWDEGSAHPSDRLPDQGLAFRALEITVPDPEGLARALAPLGPLPVTLRRGLPCLRAEIATPQGPVFL